MLGVNLNEVEIVNKATQGEFIIDNKSEIVKLLIKNEFGKYDKKDNFSYDELLSIKENILNTISKCESDFTRPKWEDYVKKQINKYSKNLERFNNINNKLTNVKNIQIYKNELNIIRLLNNIKLEKIAFILLVYCKIGRVLRNNDSKWITQKLSDIFKEAKIIGNNESKMKMLNELCKNVYDGENEYIDCNLDGRKTSIEVKYINDNLDEKVEFEINNFDGVVYEYLKYKGEKWKQCKKCSKWFQYKSNNKYLCNKCQNTKTKENKLKYWKNNKKLEK